MCTKWNRIDYHDEFSKKYYFVCDYDVLTEPKAKFKFKSLYEIWNYICLTLHWHGARQ